MQNLHVYCDCCALVSQPIQSIIAQNVLSISGTVVALNWALKLAYSTPLKVAVIRKQVQNGSLLYKYVHMHIQF